MFSRILLTVAFCAATCAAANPADIVITQVASTSHPVPKMNAKGAAVGFNAFFGRINADGGINGRKVVLDVRDDHFVPEQTVNLVKNTISDSPALALFATTGSACLAALVKSGVLASNDTALVGPISGIPTLLSAPNVFPVRANYLDELHAIVKHAHSMFRKRTVFLQLDTPFASTLSKELSTGMAANGSQVLDSVSITPVPDPALMKQNIVNIIDQELALAPDSWVVFGPGNIGPVVINALHEKAKRGVLIYLMSVSSADDVTRLAGTNAEGVIISQALPLPFDSGNRVVRQYISDMKKYAPNEKIDHLTLEGYLGARVLYEGLKRAGPKLNRANLLASLNSLGKYDLGDFEIDYIADQKHGSELVDMTLIDKTGRLIH